MKKLYELCKSVKDTSNFKRRHSGEMFNILKGPLNCNSKHVIYLFKCTQYQYCFLCGRSTKIKFRHRINSYKSTQRKFQTKYVEKDLVIVIM